MLRHVLPKLSGSEALLRVLTEYLSPADKARCIRAWAEHKWRTDEMMTEEDVRVPIDEKWVGKVRERRKIYGRELLVGEPFETAGGWICRFWFAGALQVAGETPELALAAMDAEVAAWVNRMRA